MRIFAHTRASFAALVLVSGLVVTQTSAQVGPPTVVRTTGTDTTARQKSKSDSARRQRPDSIQQRIGRDNDAPPSLEIGQSYTLTRDAFYRSGALTLADVLNRIPGLTTFRSGFLPAPQVVAAGGDFGRVRIFYDGVEIDNLEARNGGVPDLKGMPLWLLERVTITRAANELRIDIRTWEYNNTTPYTRFDLLTGDLNSTLYRAFYGKRYYNGTGLQIAGEQFSVLSARDGGGGDQVSLFGRYGVGRKFWSADVTVLRDHSTRTITVRQVDFGQNLPNYRETNTLAYVRASIGQQGSGPFIQFVASTQSLKETSSHFDVSSAAFYNVPTDTLDSLSSLSQYVTTAGYDRGPLRVRLIDRYRARNGFHYNSPSATADFSTVHFSLNGLVEHDAYTGYDQAEGGVRLLPLPFFAISAVAGQRNADHTRSAQPDSRSARLEAGLRLRKPGLWLSGGVVTRDTTILIAPVVFDSAFRDHPIGRQTGLSTSLRGPVGRGFSIEASGTRWNDTAVYVPQYQAHAELEFATAGIGKIPAENFSFRVVPMYDYRSRVAFARAADESPTAANRVLSLLVEIRILRAEITYQRRNTNLVIYKEVPGYFMPRGLNLYGVRWHFLN